MVGKDFESSSIAEFRCMRCTQSLAFDEPWFKTSFFICGRSPVSSFKPHHPAIHDGKFSLRNHPGLQIMRMAAHRPMSIKVGPLERQKGPVKVRSARTKSSRLFTADDITHFHIPPLSCRMTPIRLLLHTKKQTCSQIPLPFPTTSRQAQPTSRRKGQLA
jgi:hypothetical protein